MSVLPRLHIFKTESLNAYIRQHFPAVGKTFGKDYVALHGWARGAVELSGREEALLQQLRKSAAPSTAEASALQARLPGSFFEAGDVNIDQLIDRSVVYFPAGQNHRELRRFLVRVVALAPKVVVEIGTASGGLLYCLTQVAAPDATLISIDLGFRATQGIPVDADRDVFRAFARAGQRCQFIRGSSLALHSLRSLERILGGRRIDLLFIDGCHDYGAVKSDFEMYAPFVAENGIVALHDINVFPEQHGPGMDVGCYWNELKARYEVEEIIDREGAASLADLRHRMQEFTALNPRFVAVPSKLSTRERLACELGSDFVIPPHNEHPMATGYRAILEMPGRYQMAWGIGLLRPANRLRT